MLEKTVLLLVLAVLCSIPACADDPQGGVGAFIPLPSVTFKSRTTVEQALKERRSVRTYSDASLSLHEVSQLLWAAQGITEPAHGLRTAPSARAVYPLEVYLVAGHVEGLSAGVYRYVPKNHQLEVIALGDQREGVGKQPQMTSAPALIIYAADSTKLKKLGDKGMIFAAMEVGHSAQNVLLEEVALGLVGVGMAGYDENGVRTVLKLPEDQTPMYVVSAGRKR